MTIEDQLPPPPNGWDVRPLKRAATINRATLGDDTRDDFEFRYIDISSVESDGRIDLDEPITFDQAPSRARRMVAPGDTVISTVRTYLKAISRITEDQRGAIASTGFAVLTPRSDLDPDYLWRWVQSDEFVGLVQANSIGIGYPSIAPSDLGLLPIFVPPMKTQRAIASFLDRETARIDTLIEKKRRLLDLLEEKRTALITRGVTRGFDPDVPMKDSEVEWIGEIPEHWNVGRLPWHTAFREGPGILAKDFRSEGVPLLRIGNLQAGVVTADFDDFLAPEMVASKWSHMRAREGDLLVSASATAGQASVVTKDAEGAVPYTGLIRFRPKSTVDAEYLRHFLSSPAFLFQVNALKTGVAIQHFGPTHLRRVHIPLPPLAEQRAIAARVDHAEERIDGLVRRISAAMALLREYRTALISAAVTGGMDVSKGEEKR